MTNVKNKFLLKRGSNKCNQAGFTTNSCKLFCYLGSELRHLLDLWYTAGPGIAGDTHLLINPLKIKSILAILVFILLIIIDCIIHCIGFSATVSVMGYNIVPSGVRYRDN